MSVSPERNTIYLEPHIHQALLSKARNNGLTVSEVVDDAVRSMLHKDDLDLQGFAVQGSESHKGMNKQH